MENVSNAIFLPNENYAGLWNQINNHVLSEELSKFTVMIDSLLSSTTAVQI